MTHLGKHQRAIRTAMRAGAVLYKDADGWWYLAHPDRVGTKRVRAESVTGMLTHGYIMSDGTEDHPTYRGGERTRYRLTQKGEMTP